ncbi:MAG: MBL fold metallo-hydrolase [bacterium]|nr:MBL fold metallo-hydrolase [bacterium]
MRVSPHAHAVTGLGFIPPWSVNAGFIVGAERTLVVDTGPSSHAARTILGYARAVRPSNTLLAVNTERHTDHMLGNGVFRANGMDIYGHSSIRRTAADLAAEIEELNRCISQPFRRERGEAAVFFRGTTVENPNRPVETETVMDLGGCEARLIPTPGHTASNLSVFCAVDAVLFSGDCVVTGYAPNLDDPTLDRQAWLESLDLLSSLHAAVLVPGHGEVLTGDAVREGIERMKKEIDGRLNRL